MSNKQPKTDGLEWLLLSLSSFNGSGYADMNSPKDFLESYIAYKSLRKKKANIQAINLARLYTPEALAMLEKLLPKTAGAGRHPAEKYVKRVQEQRRTMTDQLGLL